ncbi:MAG TPA: hypothetical protein VNT75_13735 [Symbiobacteriaceae bacterium]|nr:hypothetical protein [Symbiobacteriaceae bacterium]
MEQVEKPAEKPRELMDREVQDSPVLLDLLERARESGQTLVTYQGTIFAITPVEDITHTFTPEELEEFAAHYAAAEDPENHLTVEQALARYRQRVRRHG